MRIDITRLLLYNIKIIIIFVKATTGALTFNEAVVSEHSTKSHRNLKCIFFKNSAFVSLSYNYIYDFFQLSFQLRVGPVFP